jgi:hypothetical protein
MKNKKHITVRIRPIRDEMLVERMIADNARRPVRDEIWVKDCVPNGTPLEQTKTVFYQHSIPNGINKRYKLFISLS